MNQEPKVLILAGGFATRLWPLTEKRAKPLLMLGGKPLIAHIIDKIPSHLPILISTNQAFREDFEALQKRFSGRTLELFFEDRADDKSKKGALAATAMVIEEFGVQQPLLVIAGDNYFGFRIEDFLGAYQGTTLLASYDTKSLEKARQFGVLTIRGKRLESFVEKPSDPASTLVSTGCYVFSPEHLPLLQRYAQGHADNLGGIFEFLLEQQQAVEVFPFEEDWIDIGSFESYLEAHRQLQREHFIDPSSNASNTVLETGVYIGKNCHVRNSVLDQVMILDDCVIEDARLRGCIIDRGCRIRGIDLDRKMIRAGSELSA